MRFLVWVLFFLSFSSAHLGWALNENERLWVHGSMLGAGYNVRLFILDATGEAVGDVWVDAETRLGASSLTENVWVVQGGTLFEVDQEGNFTPRGQDFLPIEPTVFCVGVNDTLYAAWRLSVEKFFLNQDRSFKRERLADLSAINKEPIAMTKSAAGRIYVVIPLDPPEHHMYGLYTIDSKTRSFGMIHTFNYRIESMTTVGQDLFVSSFDVGIEKLAGGNPPPVLYASSVASAGALAADSEGNLYVWDNSTHVILQVHPDESTQIFNDTVAPVTQLYVTNSAPTAVELLAPIADTYVRENNSNSHGSETRLLAKDQFGNRRQGYLKFDLSSLSTNVLAATLKITLSDATWPETGTGIVEEFLTESWDESMIWNTRPSNFFIGNVVGIISLPATPHEVVELDVTDFVTDQVQAGQGFVCFTLRSTSNNNSGFGIQSRESTAPPELTVTVQSS